VVNLPPLRRPPPSPATSAKRADPGVIRISRGRVELSVDLPESRGGPSKVALDGLGLTLERVAPGERLLVLNLNHGLIIQGAREIPLSLAETHVTLTEQQVSVPNLELTAGELHLTIAGATVSPAPPHDLEGELHAALPLAWLSQLPLKAPPLQGRAEISVKVRRRAESLTSSIGEMRNPSSPLLNGNISQMSPMR